MSAPPPATPLPDPAPSFVGARWGLGEAVGGWLCAFFASMVVSGIVLSITGWTASDMPIWGSALLQVPLWAVLLGAVMAARARGLRFREDLRWGFRWFDAPVGLVAGLGMQWAVGLIYVVLNNTGVDTSGTAETANRLARAAGDRWWGWLVFALIVGVGAPVVEEVFYRGLVLQGFRKRGLTAAMAVVFSSVWFAAAHFQPISIPGLAVLALVLGASVFWTDRLGPAVWIHVGFNLTTVVALWVQRTG